MSNKSPINLFTPVVLLNGLVTDKNTYTKERKMLLLKYKNKLNINSMKNPQLKEPFNEIEDNTNKEMELSEDEDDEDEVKIVSNLDNVISRNKEKENKNQDNIKFKINKEKEELKDISKSLNKQNPKIDLAESKSYPKKKKNKTMNRTDIKRQKKTKKEKEEIEEGDNKSQIIIPNFSDQLDLPISKSINIIYSNEDNMNNVKKISKNSISKKYQRNPFITRKKEEKIEIKLEYKNIQKVSTYEDINKLRKNNEPGLFISLFDENELMNIIEEKSNMFMMNKKFKKEKKENVIISSKDNEIDLTKELFYLLKKNKNLELFNKLSPEKNNILQYMPIHYIGINTFGYMNIYYCSNSSNNVNNKNDDEIHFITNYFNDKNEEYILQFRKYILNLSCFKSNEICQNDKDYNIYHIIIPKKSINKININLDQEKSLESLISKLNCDYYFYCQRPGELFIIEPESILLSYYSKESQGRIPFNEKNYLIMFWNKMNTDSFSDYLILQNLCKNGKYKNFPIVNTLVNLVDKNYVNLSNDIIKIILEIYNDMDNYENINKYIKEINDNNIRFHKLYINGIYLCQHCQQEIFNFYVYTSKYKSNALNFDKNHFNKNMIIENENNEDYIDDMSSGEYICINCAYGKNYFTEEKNIIFFKYTKEELKNFITKITSKINNVRNREKKDINQFNFSLKRKDDCINVDEFLLKIDGPLRTLDKELTTVDKYLKLLVKKNEINNANNNNENNDLINIDPLDPSNFKNNIEDKDIYEKMDLDFMHQMDVSYGLVEPKMMSSNHSNKNNEKINFIPLNSTNIFNLSDNEKDDSGIKGHISEDSKSKEKDKKYNNNIKGNRKNKKKNTTSLADVIFNGEF
jgi:hypothetical protein